MSRTASFLRQQLPFLAILMLGIGGVAYTNISHQPLVGYWEFLAVAIGLVCVVAKWTESDENNLEFVCCGRKRSTGRLY
jgi:hypothetical protein